MTIIKEGNFVPRTTLDKENPERYHEKRDKMLGACLDALKRGEGIPSIRALAKCASISPMSFYTYYKDPDALVNEIQRRTLTLLNKAGVSPWYAIVTDRAEDVLHPKVLAHVLFRVPMAPENTPLLESLKNAIGAGAFQQHMGMFFYWLSCGTGTGTTPLPPEWETGTLSLDTRRR